MNCDVMILFEHANRELKNACLLKKRLEQIGISAEIQKIMWNDGLHHLFCKPKLLLVPWCYDNYHYYDFLKKWKGAYKNGKIKILNMHYEQISNSSGIKTLIPKDKAKDIYHMAWGENFKKLLIQNGIEEKKIFVTGSLSLDMYSKENLKYLKNRKELSELYNLTNGKKWVLIVGNFSAKNICYIDEVKKRGYGDFDKWIDLSKKTYYELINWYKYILNNEIIKNNYEIIYRPHPNETLTEELLLLKKTYTNFHIINELSISDWVANIDISFSWSSTSAIDFIVANKIILNLRPYPLINSLKFPIIEKIKKVVSKEEFLDTIINCENIIKKNYYDDIVEEVKDYYCNFDEKSSITKLIDAIKFILSDNFYINTQYDYFFAILKTLSFYIKTLLLKLNIKTNKYGLFDIVLNDVKHAKEINKYFNYEIN